MLEQYSDGGISIKKPDTTNQSMFIYFEINLKKCTKQVKNDNAVCNKMNIFVQIQNM